MSSRISPAGVLRLVAVALVVASLIVFAAVLGPSRALRIAGASVSGELVDGLAERPGPHRIPIIDLRIDQQRLDSLEADLPWSGGRNVKATLVENGIAHKVRFRYRGVVSPSHFLGGKKSFRLAMKKSNPWAPYQRINVINPKAHNLLNNHMATWIAGTMGVPVPMDEMVFTRINGADIGVMEAYEQVDGDFERNRHQWAHEVPVYKGDYPPVKERALPKGLTLWANAAHWEYASDADSMVAHDRLTRLIAALRKDTLPVESHRDSIAALIDVETFIRYHAALLVLSTTHIDQYHNQWLVLNPRTGRFYPVLWDALMLFPPPDDPLYYVNDAIAWWIAQVPEWRLRRDRAAYQALVNLQRNGAFEARLDAVVDRIRPSVLADRNKHGNVTLQAEDVHRTSVLHTIGSLAGLRAMAAAHWQRTLARLERKDAGVERGVTLRIRWTAEPPIRLNWTGEATEVRVNDERVATERTEHGWTVLLHRALAPSTGGKDHPLADKQHLLVQELDARIEFASGLPTDLRITNAITDEPVD